MGNLQQLCENLKQEITIPNTVDYFEFLSSNVLILFNGIDFMRSKPQGSLIAHIPLVGFLRNVQLKFIQIKEMLDLQRCECELSPWSVCSTHACNCGNRAAIVKINNCCGDISTTFKLLLL